MGKITNLTPRFKDLKPAEQEFLVPYTAGELPLGNSAGGLSLYSTKFKRGYGDKVFGSDENGIWLGKAEFDGAPFRVDMDGNVIANSIELATTSILSSGGAFNHQFTTGSEVDVPGASFTFTLEKAQNVFIAVSASGYMYRQSGGDYGGEGNLILKIDGGTSEATEITGALIGTDSSAATSIMPMSLHHLESLAAGPHTIKLVGKVSASLGNPGFNLYRYTFSYFTLGNS